MTMDHGKRSPKPSAMGAVFPYTLTALGEEMWDGCRVILSG
jgi:hypothetical protein